MTTATAGCSSSSLYQIACAVVAVTILQLLLVIKVSKGLELSKLCLFMEEEKATFVSVLRGSLKRER